MIKLSIIIPVYNVEKYIHDCIESCLKQNLSRDEYEIIFINDGSIDKSRDIILEYKNENIVLIDKINGGVSSARNLGIENAKGKYIWFVDPDDYIRENVLLDLINILETYNLDKLEFNYKCVNENDKREISCLNNYSNICNIKKNIKQMPKEGYSWKYIIKKEILLDNNIRFLENVPMYEDIHFTFLLDIHINNYLKLEEYIYYYRNREGSITKTYTNEKLKEHILGRIIIASFYKELIQKNKIKDKDIIKLLNYTLYFETQGAISLLISTGNIDYCKEVLEEMNKRGLYPYKMNFINLKNSNSARKIIINILALLYPYRWYTLLCCFIYGKLKYKGLNRKGSL